MSVSTAISTAAVATLTIKSPRPRDLARFYRDLLGYQVAPNHSDSVLLQGDGPALLIQPADAPAPSGALHLDLRPTDQAACVAHALALGARRLDVGQVGDESWVVLADPDGNAFCVLQSAADYAALLATDPGTPTPLE